MDEYKRLVDNLRKGYTLGEAWSRVSPFKLANFFSALEGITGSPYVLGDISAQVTKAAEDASAIDFEEFGDELKNKEGAAEIREARVKKQSNKLF